MDTNHKICISASDIGITVSEIAIMLNIIIKASDNTSIYVCVMNGAVQFFKDVTSLLPSGYCHYISASSYKSNSIQTELRLNVPTLPEHYSNESLDIFIFDDICDTGETLKSIVKEYHRNYPNSCIHTIALLHRDRHDAVYRPNFRGIHATEGSWFAGYGMDNNGLDRNLPYIYIVEDI